MSFFFLPLHFYSRCKRRGEKKKGGKGVSGMHDRNLYAGPKTDHCPTAAKAVIERLAVAPASGFFPQREKELVVGEERDRAQRTQ